MFRPLPPRLSLPATMPTVFLTRDDLLERGLRSQQITSAVSDGSIVRARRGRYLPGDCHPAAVASIAAGGRLDCVTLLGLLGVFVEKGDGLHIQVEPDATRLPDGHSGMIRHWRPTSAPTAATVTPIVEALAQAVRCQTPRAAIATLDSAWHHRVVDETEIAQVFALLPRRYRRLRHLLDPRAESGTETFVRLMLRSLGCDFDLQVDIDGVGFVDLLVGGWLIVECDSERFHGDWEAHKRDRRRDAAAAALGYMTLRFLAEDILFHPDRVMATLRAVLARHPVAR